MSHNSLIHPIGPCIVVLTRAERHHVAPMELCVPMRSCKCIHSIALRHSPYNVANTHIVAVVRRNPLVHRLLTNYCTPWPIQQLAPHRDANVANFWMSPNRGQTARGKRIGPSGDESSGGIGWDRAGSSRLSSRLEPVVVGVVSFGPETLTGCLAGAVGIRRLLGSLVASGGGWCPSAWN